MLVFCLCKFTFHIMVFCRRRRQTWLPSVQQQQTLSPVTSAWKHLSGNNPWVIIWRFMQAWSHINVMSVTRIIPPKVIWLSILWSTLVKNHTNAVCAIPHLHESQSQEIVEKSKSLHEGCTKSFCDLHEGESFKVQIFYMINLFIINFIFFFYKIFKFCLNTLIYNINLIKFF